MPAKIDSLTWIALVCVLLGWFGLNTLVATFGPVVHVVHFYDLPVVMRDPRWLVVGVSDEFTLSRLVFGFACLITVTAPLLPRLGFPRVPYLLGAAPLLLMLLCSIVLYVKSSSAHVDATASLGKWGGYLAKWTNGATNWSGDVVASHISVGAGGYLSFFASGFLAIRGVLRTIPKEVNRSVISP
jgi:hypothetical protein